MYIHMYIYIHINTLHYKWLCTSLCKIKCKYLYVYMCIYIYVYVCTCIHVYKYMYIYICIVSAYILSVYICTYLYVGRDAYIHNDVYVYACIRIYAHVCTVMCSHGDTSESQLSTREQTSRLLEFPCQRAAAGVGGLQFSRGPSSETLQEYLLMLQYERALDLMLRGASEDLNLETIPSTKSE